LSVRWMVKESKSGSGALCDTPDTSISPRLMVIAEILRMREL